ncbi:MAG: TetR/AcrR family transcriptional regulator [Actinomycetia bacterium]|nr:TetR/AcrR family transcriptional regulator [Actinomycetes bacterium]
MEPEGQEQATPRVDGRRLRREQGRLAVIDAMIDLVLEGHSPPPADLVAVRAGVSQASVFRYFATLDELRGEGIRRYFERYSSLMEIPDIGEHSLARRIENLVEARVHYHQTTEPVARLARRQAATITELSETLTRVRSTFTDQLSHHFEPELDTLAPAARRQRLAVIAALTSFESWVQLREHGLTPAQVRRSLGQSLDLLLRPTT